MMYFDFAATTPMAASVKKAMEPYLTDCFYNASSLYRGGRTAAEAVSHAREQVAALVCAEPEQVIFTSGGTEADNMAVLCGALAGKKQGRSRVVVSAIEHHAVLSSAEYLEELGFSLTVLPVDAWGRVDARALERVMDDRVALVSVMWVNNELGTVQDVPALAEVAHRYGALFHTDAVQAVGTQEICFAQCGADLMSISAHKIYGPKGCGALITRSGLRLPPLIHGGQQESGRRGGTENVGAIVGFGAAAAALRESRGGDVSQMRRLRELLLELLRDEGIRINSPADGAPSILNVAFRDVEAEGMLFYLGMEDICVSMGSACNSQSVEPSHVIQAIRVPPEYARGCIRISLGHGVTEENCRALAHRLMELAQQLRY